MGENGWGANSQARGVAGYTPIRGSAPSRRKRSGGIVDSGDRVPDPKGMLMKSALSSGPVLWPLFWCNAAVAVGAWLDFP